MLAAVDLTPPVLDSSKEDPHDKDLSSDSASSLSSTSAKSLRAAAVFSDTTILRTFVSALAILLMGGAMLLGDSIQVQLPTNWAFEMQSMPIAALLLMLVGLCTSVMWTSIFNMATEGLGKYTAKASGIFMTMVVGGGVLPYLQSVVAAENALLSYLVPVLGVAYILFYALAGSKNVNTDIKVD